MILENANQVKTKVHYNRQAKTWQTINGQVKDFGRGPEAKRQALLEALAHDHPQMALTVSAIAAQNDNEPQIIDRLIKAAQLLVKGKVFIYGPSHIVASQSLDDNFYKVKFDGMPKAYYCDCPDFDFGLAKDAGEAKYGAPQVDGLGTMCKHSLAVYLGWCLGVELPNWASLPGVIPFTQNQLVLQLSQRESIEDYLG